MKKDELLNELYKLNRFEVSVGVLDFMSKTAVKLNHVLALVEQLDEPEKVVIPQFVADWWERDAGSVTLYGGLQVKKEHKFSLISKFQDRGLGDYLSKTEDWIDENKSIFLDLVNGKPYEVEKEPLYIISIPKTDDVLACLKSEDDFEFTSEASIVGNSAWKYTFTESEIKSIDKRFWAFAVEVES